MHKQYSHKHVNTCCSYYGSSVCAKSTALCFYCEYTKK